MSVVEFGKGLFDELRTRPLTFLALLGLMGFAVYAWATYATADDLSSIRKDMAQQMAQLERKVDNQAEKLDEVLVLQVSAAIRTTHAQLCMAEPPERRSLRDLLDQLQTRYQRMSPDGERYPVGACPTG